MKAFWIISHSLNLHIQRYICKNWLFPKFLIFQISSLFLVIKWVTFQSLVLFSFLKLLRNVFSIMWQNFSIPHLNYSHLMADILQISKLYLLHFLISLWKCRYIFCDFTLGTNIYVYLLDFSLGFIFLNKIFKKFSVNDEKHNTGLLFCFRE